MRYRHFVYFRHGIWVFVNFSYGIAVLGTPQCPPPTVIQKLLPREELRAPVQNHIVLRKNKLEFYHYLKIRFCLSINATVHTYFSFSLRRNSFF